MAVAFAQARSVTGGVWRQRGRSLDCEVQLSHSEVAIACAGLASQPSHELTDAQWVESLWAKEVFVRAEVQGACDATYRRCQVSLKPLSGLAKQLVAVVPGDPEVGLKADIWPDGSALAHARILTDEGDDFAQLDVFQALSQLNLASCQGGGLTIRT